MNRDVTERSGGDAASADIAFLSDAALVEGLRLRQAAAIHVLYERYSGRVLRTLHRLLGNERELSDLHHDVFVRALHSIRGLKDPSRLEAWLTGVAVFTARSTIQRRVRRRWLQFMAPEALPEAEAVVSSNDASEALRATYAALEQLAVDERIAFVLRFIEGMELKEGAVACSVSLATFKRRLARAEERFTELASSSPVLRDWLEGGSRWGEQKIR
jgi:RNA polymerase sigma-70 factor (ECF subfamily)